MQVNQRKQRVRRTPAAFSPTDDTPSSKKCRKPKLKVDDNPRVLAPSLRPEYKRLEKKIKSQAHRLQYSLAFIEAYEAEGWRKANRDKLKPSKELEAEHIKIAKGKRALIDGLCELKALNDDEPQVPLHAMFEDVHCSRCGSTEIEPGNDILLCDSPGCHRAYHQQCQTPIVLTDNIPVGDDSWFCEVCLAVFECLKSINSVFGTTYESTDDLFPELLEQAAVDANITGQSDRTSSAAAVNENDDEEEDEDFVCDESEAEVEDESDEETLKEVVDDEEEVAEEVPESAQDLLFLRQDDVIDMNHRSMRSEGKSCPPKPKRKKSLLGETVAKLDRKTRALIFGVVAELKPPAEGKYSRWRVNYRDGSSELLTRSKLQAAIDRANSNGDRERDGSEDSMAPIVRSKRKRNEVDYRQLNELMFAGKDEDSEDDETFEVKESSDDELDDEGENNDEEEPETQDKVTHECGERVLDQPSPNSVTAPPDKISEQLIKKRSRRERPAVNYLLMHEGLLS
ncbi:hypothetical protein PsorP6_008221 [Peronosclerospora sorghi]|uniref:Uncharacterized protein n=1 Tax=Peronosclerospora sorghi TaxID=230839 RepID=A0ACC0WAE5_9STRA|nr:hypothetical protein PsorP6_008221 [Peronosclerospora sorghi]